MTLKTKTCPRSKRGENMVIEAAVIPFLDKQILVGLYDGAVCFTGFDQEVAIIHRYYPKATLKPYEGNLKTLQNDLLSVWQQDNVANLDLYVEGTDFQINVWRTLLNIKAGAPIHYRDIAQKLNKPKAMRAVGNAVGANPVSIFIPCHRVIHAGGNKMGYAWGVDIKRDLIAAEEKITH